MSRAQLLTVTILSIVLIILLLTSKPSIQDILIYGAIGFIGGGLGEILGKYVHKKFFAKKRKNESMEIKNGEE